MPDQSFDGVPVLIPLSEYRTLLYESFRLREERERRVRAEGERAESRREAARLRDKVSQLEALLPRPYTGPHTGDPITFEPTCACDDRVSHEPID